MPRLCATHNNYSRFIAYYIFWFLCCFQLERSWSCPATMTIILNGTLYVHCTDTRCSRVCPRRTYKSIEQQDHKVINQKTKLEYSVFFFFFHFILPVEIVMLETFQYGICSCSSSDYREWISLQLLCHVNWELKLKLKNWHEALAKKEKCLCALPMGTRFNCRVIHASSMIINFAEPK